MIVKTTTKMYFHETQAKMNTHICYEYQLLPDEIRDETLAMQYNQMCFSLRCNSIVLFDTWTMHNTLIHIMKMWSLDISAVTRRRFIEYVNKYLHVYALWFILWKRIASRSCAQSQCHFKFEHDQTEYIETHSVFLRRKKKNKSKLTLFEVL